MRGAFLCVVAVIVGMFLADAALSLAQVWNHRSSTPFLHLKYRTNEDDNRNLDKIDAAIQAVTPTTTTTETVTTTTETPTTTTAEPTTTTTAP